MAEITLTPPAFGSKIESRNGKLVVPDAPVIPFIEGDGTGPDIWRAASRVMDAAVQKAYAGNRKIAWLEVYAGEKSFNLFGTWLPDETIQAFATYLVGIKGPLTTPVGGGIRSLNVALRKNLDLYTCLRPVRWFQGVPSPARHPERVNMVIFRENTEDLYSGIEFAAGSPQSDQMVALLKEHFPAEYAKLRFPQNVGIGIKPVSVEGSERLIRAALRWALENRRKRLTLVHKGNIMKFTEGAFRNWGYELAEREFGPYVYTSMQWERTKEKIGEAVANEEMSHAIADGKLYVNDVITDAAFDRTLARPADFDVLVTTNLNGDYLSDALAAQIGGIGIAPGANINFETGVAVFEATHGTAPKYTNLNVANPSSVLLSGEMMFRYMGWNEAADLVIQGIEKTIAAKTLTNDLYKLTEGATLLKTSEFGDAIIHQIENL